MPSIKDTRRKLKISSVHFKGYKSIEDLEVTLNDGLNIIIGQNASGKSNFLECLDEAASIRGRHSNKNYRYANLKLHDEDDNSFIIETERDWQKFNPTEKEIKEEIKYIEKIWYNKKLIFDNSKEEKTYFTSKDKKIRIGRIGSRLFSLMDYSFPFLLFIKFNLPNDLAYINTPGTIKISLQGDTQDEFMDYWDVQDTLDSITELFFDIEASYKGIYNDIKGIGKSTFYKKLKLKDNISNSLRKYTPIKDIRFNENINIYKEDKIITIDNLKLDFKVNNNWIPWSSLSHGTKRLFYLVAEIANENNAFILVEEPELGIHPHQFHLIMDFLSHEARNKQIFVATHSPQALNYLKENQLDQIITCFYDEKKGTQMEHLTKQQINKAKKYMSEVGFLSDYWMLSDLEQ